MGVALAHSQTRLDACYLEATLELAAVLVALLSLVSLVFSEPRPNCRQRVDAGRVRAQT